VGAILAEAEGAISPSGYLDLLEGHHALYLTKGGKLVIFTEDPKRGATINVFDDVASLADHEYFSGRFGDKLPEVAQAMGEDFTLEID
jgi:hypothetical protein